MAPLDDPAFRGRRGAGPLQNAGMVIVALAVAALLLAGCSSAGRDQSASVAITCDQFQQSGGQQQTRSVDLTVGGQLRVTLCSNPTTGFQWGDAAIADTTVLGAVDHHYTAPGSATPAVVGAAGQEEWTFNALKAGKTTVAFRYSQPWAGGQQNAWTLDLTVNVGS